MFFSKSLPSLLIIWIGRMYFRYYSIPFTADFPNLFLVFFDSIFRDFQYFFQFFKAFFRIFFCTIVPKTHNCRSRTQILANKLAHQTHNWIRHFCPYILFYVDSSETFSEKEANKQIHLTVYIPYDFKGSLNIPICITLSLVKWFM